ncbi:baseplate hub assembly protein [Serratia phage PS2]|uniref:Baseplate hub assembly protein n=1 Tax=Serratia phage PS2 TaxID=1481112 RepID=A0A023W598_9CAUD|nr:baseplate hub assembly protein [Serratia phage PS2]AHY25445.1 baseplate hub assembly protein [Serratia phage PS2]
MANILRVKLPTGTTRHKMFTVQDYRDFILIRKDMEENPSESETIFNELLEELYPDYPPEYRGYLFVEVLTSSIGKKVIPIVFSCQCKHEITMNLRLHLPELKEPVIETAGIKIHFKIPVKHYEDDALKFQESIYKVSDQDSVYLWEELSQDEKNQVIEAVDFNAFQEAMKILQPVQITQKIACPNCGQVHVVQRDSACEIFKLMIAVDEIFLFYRVNRLLVRNSYSNQDVMSMLPLERNIALSFIQKENQPHE